MDGPARLVDVAQLDDGRIVALGVVAEEYSPFERTFVVRLLADGTLDTSWSRDGFAVQLPASGYGELQLVTDPRTQLVGIARSATFGTTMLRLAADGRIDVAYGDSGIVARASFAAALRRELATASIGPVGWALRPDGSARYVAASQRVTRRDRLVAFTASGALDAAFGTGGVAEPVAPTSTSRYLNAGEGMSGQVHLLDDGRVVVVSAGVGERIEIARYLPDGRRDTTFSGDGIQYARGIAPAFQPSYQDDVDEFTGMPLASSLASAIDAQGRVVVVAGDRIFRVLRSVSFDATFGGGRGERLRRAAQAVALDGAGRIMLATGRGVERLAGGSASVLDRRVRIVGPGRCGRVPRRACVVGGSVRVLRGRVSPPPPVGWRMVRVRWRNTTCTPGGRVIERWLRVRADGTFVVPLRFARSGRSRWTLEFDAFAARGQQGASATAYVRAPLVRCAWHAVLV